MKRKLDKKGFTLVELIVVIVIILVLAAVLVPSLMKYIKSARLAKYTNEANEIVKCVKYAEVEIQNNSVLNGGTDYDIGEGIGNFRVNIRENGTGYYNAILFYRTNGSAKNDNEIAKTLMNLIQEKVNLKGISYMSLVFDMNGSLVENGPRPNGQKNYYGQDAKTTIKYYDGTTLVYYDGGGWKIE